MPSVGEKKYLRNENKRRVEALDKKKSAYFNDSIKNYEVNKNIGLLDFLFEKMPKESKNNVKMLLSKGFIAVNGLRCSQFNFELFKGDSVQLAKKPFEKADNVYVKRKNDKDYKDTSLLDIIYEDEDFIAINKPSGLLSMESDKEKTTTAYKMVLEYINKQDKFARCFQIHRLDKDTSGVLIFTKSYELNEALKSSWNSIVKTRKYTAVVDGMMEKKKGTIEEYLMKDETNLMFAAKDKKHGEKAITHYIVKKENAKYSLLDVYIDSGKKNQIRVAMNNLGHPIIGDDKYGKPTNPIKRLGLHAEVLELINPLNGREYKFYAETPSVFRKLFK